MSAPATSIRDRARLVQANAKRMGDEAEPPPAEPLDDHRTFGDV